ncbi:MAG: DMT family transporter [Runella sp.]
MVASVAHSSKNTLLSWVLLVLLALIWGSSFILMKKSLDTYTALELGAGRLFFGALFFIPIIIRTYRQVPSHRYPYLFASAMLGAVIPAFLFAYAGTRLNSSLSGMLNSLSPLFTLIIGFVFFGQPRRWLQGVGILIGLGGSLLLIFAQKSTGINLTDPYALLIVAATIMYGVNINNIAKNLSHLPALAITALMFVFIGPMALVVLSFTDFFSKIGQSDHLQATLFVAILGIIGTGIATMIFNRIVQMSSGLFASSVTYLIPIVAMGWGFWDGENITLQQLVGMCTILTGVYLVNKKSL